MEKSIFGLGLFIGVVAIRHGYDCGCKTAQLLAINDSDLYHSKVVRLRTENHNLIDKLNHMSESHDKVVQENARLKEESSDLRQMIADMQIGNSFACTFRDFDEEVPINTSQLRAESSNQSNSSLDLIN
ncbi:hypothetical protein RIF29_22741 [Crotalaria pallida]|uniref:Uncharacterized protein n=1 Tax=Crotalaria pallida TaxID=3830 RepID=A0AAN9F6Z4_CROPI